MSVLLVPLVFLFLPPAVAVTLSEGVGLEEETPPTGNRLLNRGVMSRKTPTQGNSEWLRVSLIHA